jgi:hypothetical protein
MRQQGGESHAVEISTESESSIVVQNSGNIQTLRKKHASKEKEEAKAVKMDRTK